MPVWVTAADTDNADTQSTGQRGTQPDAQVVISQVIVNRSNIFDTPELTADGTSQQQAASLIAVTANRFHRITLESVITREAGVKPGDVISVAEVEEIERRLRRLGIFSSVAVRLVTGSNGVELHITTRDNISLVAGASGSFLGGVGDIGITVGDKNLLGTANELLFDASRTTEGEFRGAVTFTDLHFFKKRWRSEYGIGRTNDGDFYNFMLRDPFQSLSDKRAWNFAFSGTERNNNFYNNGDLVIQVPEDRTRVAGSHVWRRGTSTRYIRSGFVGRFIESDYSEALGVLADDITVPEDRRTLYVGGLLGLDRIQRYKKVQGIDTLNFIQDLRLGTFAEIQLGVDYIEDFNSPQSNARSEPALLFSLSKSGSVGEHSLYNFALSGNASFEENGDRPWNSTVRFKAFNTRIKNTTLALNTDFSTGEDGSDLPVQLTLGEDNGLRGYDARQFSGRQRLRLNLESRYQPGWSLGILDIGLVGFFDAGWAAPRSDTSPELKRSIGAGLRLASNSLLGSGVIRVDLALPLDAPEGDSSSPSLSIAVGQVFRF